MVTKVTAKATNDPCLKKKLVCGKNGPPQLWTAQIIMQEKFTDAKTKTSVNIKNKKKCKQIIAIKNGR